LTRAGLIAAVVGAYAVALVVMAPATLLAPRIADATGGRLRLVEARGGVWSGSGTVEARDSTLGVATAKHIAWRVAPAALLRGALSADVVTSDSATPISVILERGRVELARVQLDVPAGMLPLIAPKLAPLQPRGTLRVDLERLAVEAHDVWGNGIVRWHSAGSDVTKLYPLGSYELRFETAGAERRATLRTLVGPLQLDGRGSWSAGARLNLQAVAEVPAAQHETLAPLLRLIARERADGRFDLALD
jgi:general secretion pathway protein N